ncbi:colicin E1 immunity protein, partial [Escherichia coli]|nr:colicin E1 immunity protein [Escherichia coli]
MLYAIVISTILCPYS